MNTLETALKPEVFPTLRYKNNLEAFPTLAPEHVLIRNIHDIFLNYQQLHDRIYEQPTAENIQDRISLYDSAYKELQSFSKYGVLPKEVQWYTANLLIDTLRESSDGNILFRRKMRNYSNIQTTKRLLSLTDVGPIATEVIMEDLSKRAYKWMDVSPGRRKRYFEKALKAQGRFTTETYVGPESESTVYRFTPNSEYKPGELGKLNQDGYVGISPFLAELNRNDYLYITSRITPANIAQMVGSVNRIGNDEQGVHTIEQVPLDSYSLLHEIEYDEICKRAAQLLPPLANPFELKAPNKFDFFEYFKTHDPNQKDDQKPIPIDTIPFFQILFARSIPITSSTGTVYEAGIDLSTLDPKSAEFW